MPSSANGSAANTNRFVAAVQTLIFLYRTEEICSSVRIAKYVQLHPTFLRRIVVQLVRANLVQAHEGRDGGYCLACPAHQITLAEVYLAVKSSSPNFLLPLETSQERALEEGLRSVLVQVMDQTEQGMLEALRRYTIADIAAQPNGCANQTG